MKKPAIEWLQLIADPVIRKQALENVTRNRDMLVDSVNVALQETFFWDDTPQKYTYWNNIWSNPIQLLTDIPETTDIFDLSGMD